MLSALLLIHATCALPAVVLSVRSASDISHQSALSARVEGGINARLEHDLVLVCCPFRLLLVRQLPMHHSHNCKPSGCSERDSSLPKRKRSISISLGAHHEPDWHAERLPSGARVFMMQPIACRFVGLIALWTLACTCSVLRPTVCFIAPCLMCCLQAPLT